MRQPLARLCEFIFKLRFTPNLLVQPRIFETETDKNRNILEEFSILRRNCLLSVKKFQNADHLSLPNIEGDALERPEFPEEPPASAKELTLWEVAPAYMISELRTAFEIGFIIFIPFIVLDLVVANILLALGMFMLSPTIISLPFKILIFVAVDGWSLIVNGLVQSFN